MRDAEMVASIVAGQTAGLAAAYDRYAPALHAYCRTLLGEPADADDAVLDTFIIAASELSGLQDPDRLRPWLYAVARNECRHRLRSRALSAAPGGADEVPDDTVDLVADAEKAELRAMVGAALAGLGPGDRDIIELNLHHELAGQDLADVLGVSLNQAYALESRAGARFQRSLGALLVARTGQESCPELADILSGWDGQMNVLLRKRINRHIERCEICGERRHELNPALLLSMLPVALPPAGLRDQLFDLLNDVGPAASAYRAGVIHRAAPFGWSGFPEPRDPPHAVYGARTYAVAAGVAALALFAAGALVGVSVLKPHTQHPPAAAGAEPFAAAPAPSVLPEATVKPTHSAGAGSSDPPLFAPIVPWVAATAGPVPISRSRPPGSQPSSPSGLPSSSPPPTSAPPSSPPPTSVRPSSPPPTSVPPSSPPPTSDPPPTSAPPTDSPSPSASASTVVPVPTLMALRLEVAVS
jgi:RNA polymerase sigma factor (sigma-70 family)